MQEIQNKAMQTYNKNMDFLKVHSPTLYEKLKLFDLALNLGEIKSTMELEYKDNSYFDIINLNDNSYFYGEDSLIYSEKIIKSTNSDLTENSFKTFKEFHFEEDVMNSANRFSALSSPFLYNASIIDYVNKNIPENRVCDQMFCYMVFGVGLGFHIEFLLKKLKPKLLYIIEPSLEVFRLSLFTTPYYSLVNKAMLIFSIAEDKDTFFSEFSEFFRKAYLYNHYLKFFLFSKNCELYLEGIQLSLSSQNHILFSYERKLYSFIQTTNYIKDDFNFINVKNKFNDDFFIDKTVLILAAGPSLYKNLEYIRKNQDRFIIVALLSMCSMLEKEGINPDIITNYDEGRDVFIKSINDIKQKNYFDDKILLLGSHVNKETINLLPKENIYFFQAVLEIKKDYGFLSAPSIGEMSYALSLTFNPKQIFLLGLDFAFDQDTGKSHSEGYFDSDQFQADKEASLEKFSFRKNVVKVKGNFRNIVETMAVYNISIKSLNGLTQQLNHDKKIEVFNLSDGAYFENVEPLYAKDFDFNSIKKMNKMNTCSEIKKSFNNYSSINLLSSDRKILEKELSSCKVLKNEIVGLFIEQKHSSVIKYHEAIDKFHNYLSSKNQDCLDLVKIIYDFNMFILPYIIYFLNMQELKNPKSHIKKLNKMFSVRLIKIIDLYIDQLEHLLKR